MSNNLVTRLRQQESEWSFDEPVRICVEAADEIERLRAENDGLRILIYTLLKKLENEVRGE